MFGQCDKQVVELNNGYLIYYVGNGGEIKTNHGGYISAVSDLPDSILFNNGHMKSLWFMGLQADTISRLSTSFYQAFSEREFMPGILDSLGEPVLGSCVVFGKIWNVRGKDVATMRTLFDAGVLSISDIPTDILTWPAKGNPYLLNSDGSVISNRKLAPFVDWDEDGIYNPLNGDYPVPLQEHEQFLPVQFTYHVYHDVTANDETKEPPLHVEVSQIVYVVDCEEYQDLLTSVFHRTTVTYWGVDHLDNMKVALLDDADLGSAGSDYAGVDLATNSVFTYSSKEAPQSDLVTIPEHITAYQATIFLDDTMNYAAQVWDGPELTVNYKNPFFGIDPFDRPAVNVVTGDTITYWYTGNPADTVAWNMRNYYRVARDQRHLVTFDNEDVSTGHQVTLNFIETTRTGVAESRPEDIFLDYELHIEGVKAQYNEMLDNLTCTKTASYDPCNEYCVWPGDVNRDSVVTLEDWVYLRSIEIIENVELNGTARYRQSTRWHPMSGKDWDNDIFGFNSKHYDVNGDGSLESTDLDRLTDNFKKSQSGVLYPHKPATTDSLGLSIIVKRSDQDSLNFYPQDIPIGLLYLEIYLGNGQHDKPIGDICFDLKVDTTNLDNTSSNSEVSFEYIDKVLDRPSQYLQEHYCFSAKGGEILNGRIYGRTIFLQESDTPDTAFVNFLIENVYAIDTSGNFIEVGVRNAPPLKDIRALTTATTEDRPSNFLLYPNPSTSEIFISSDAPILSLSLSDIDGVISLQEQQLGSSIQLNIDFLRPGIYILEIKTSEGTNTKKFVKL